MIDKKIYLILVLVASLFFVGCDDGGSDNFNQNSTQTVTIPLESQAFISCPGNVVIDAISGVPYNFDIDINFVSSVGGGFSAVLVTSTGTANHDDLFVTFTPPAPIAPNVFQATGSISGGFTGIGTVTIEITYREDQLEITKTIIVNVLPPIIPLDPESECNNGLDDDADGQIDCADSDCAASAFCLPEPDCTNGVDDDGDGLIDCDDPDCAADAACIVPTGDTCADAIEAFIGTNPFDTTALTASAITSECNAEGAGPARDVWFVFTPTTSGFVDIDTCDSTAFDTVISISTSCGGGEVDCSDDFCGSQSALIGFPVSVGIPIFIQIQGYDTSEFGAGILTIAVSVPT